MITVLITTYYHYGIEKETKNFDNCSYDDVLKWVKEEYPNAENLYDEYTFKDYDSDSTIEIL